MSKKRKILGISVLFIVVIVCAAGFWLLTSSILPSPWRTGVTAVILIADFTNAAIVFVKYIKLESERNRKIEEDNFNEYKNRGRKIW
jgi:hypothetical protein